MWPSNSDLDVLECAYVAETALNFGLHRERKRGALVAFADHSKLSAAPPHNFLARAQAQSPGGLLRFGVVGPVQNLAEVLWVVGVGVLAPQQDFALRI